MRCLAVLSGEVVLEDRRPQRGTDSETLRGDSTLFVEYLRVCEAAAA